MNWEVIHVMSEICQWVVLGLLVFIVDVRSKDRRGKL